MLGGIRTRLLGLVVAIVVPFMALVGGGLWSQWQGDQAQALKSALDEARLLVAQVDDEIGNVETLMAGLSRAVSIGSDSIQANDEILRQVKAELPGYVSNILLATLDGNNVGTSFEVAEDGRANNADRDYFQKVLGGQRLAIGEPIRGRTTHKWLTVVARPVEDRAGKLVAVMYVGILLEHFQDGLRLDNLPAGSVVQIVNENGTVITRSVDSANWVGTNLRETGYVARHSTVKQASEAVIWPDKIERITGSATAHRVPWLVSVGLPADVAMANVASRLIWGVAAGAVTLLTALMLAWAFSGHIISPLRQLSTDASTLAAGDMGHRTTVCTNDEVGALANMFNIMAASLEGRHQELIVAREAAATEATKRAQLSNLAHCDQLTGLPNRLALQTELARLVDTQGNNRPTSIALFDLDGFKDVNDTLGHSTGDQLLVEVGERLAEVAGSMRAVCRLGGDEFVVIIPDCGNPLTVGPLVDAMLNRLAEPFKINDHILHVGGSAGIAIAPGDGANVDDLIANADLALYQAKSEGGRTYRFFLPVLRAQAQARRSLDLELRRAFAENEFELYFQPQVRLADGAVVGAEALLRWQHPVRGTLASGVFIETLAASAIAPAVSRWIIRTACEKTAAWRAEGLALSRIGVNLFPTQLSDETLLKDIGDALQDSNLPTEILELEITENVALNFERATVLRKLQEKGVKLAFDDFGTGYASLSYLTRFPLARIKIDRSFVGKITDDASAAAIVRSLIAMAHNLGLEVIAEGVETDAQAEFLLNEQCEEAQGYLYAKALPAAQFEAYLKTSRLASDATKTPTDKALSRRSLPTA